VSVTVSDIEWDPWNPELYLDPYPVVGRLREEVPLYRNEEHDFWAISRFADVERMLHDQQTFIARKGTILDVMREDATFSPGLISFEDPPQHTIHRARLSRVFTPRAISRIHDDIRDYCARSLEGLAGGGEFDLVAEFAREVPMRVMGLLLGIPEADQAVLREHFLANMHREKGAPPDNSFVYAAIEEYVAHREQHPADDLMTQLLFTEFEDETGATRRLTREELITVINLVGAAGNDTTGLLIAWAVKILADHPDQRREIVEDPSLLPGAIEECLRYEPIPYAFGRWVASDAEFQGQVVPAGSRLACVPGAANRDPRQFGDDAERFDIHRTFDRHLTFGYGPHFCIGANLARLEARIALEEMFRTMPEWQVDDERAHLVRGGPNRGYDLLPVIR
jgi:cytochrome P450